MSNCIRHYNSLTGEEFAAEIICELDYIADITSKGDHVNVYFVYCQGIEDGILYYAIILENIDNDNITVYLRERDEETRYIIYDSHGDMGTIQTMIEVFSDPTKTKVLWNTAEVININAIN